MSELLFLGGKVRKRTLPLFLGAPPAGCPPLKRLMLPQGELAQFFDGEEEPIRFLAFAELRAGCVRGNHYHRKKQEWVYVIQGSVDLLVAELETGGARDSVRLEGGDLGWVAAGVAHALRTVVAGQAIEFSSARFDPADTYRYQEF